MTESSRRSCCTTSGAGRRWLRGFSRTIIRPLLRVPPPPPAPTDDMNASTAGFFTRIAAAACWWRTISSKDTSCDASVEILMSPVSSVGMNPFGRIHATSTVNTTMSPATPTVDPRWCRQNRSERS